eukprot:TRINITY_DN18454_c0_g1_i1.p1 TRINITY_DN18454_c0_g1~~TRINITY_DN18454_c0_g1_i1.p1  ORF type:complete len:285 (-),score=100.51 TRINITY_DN18454_c0_g1_i1:201-1055(-)
MAASTTFLTLLLIVMIYSQYDLMLHANNGIFGDNEALAGAAMLAGIVFALVHHAAWAGAGAAWFYFALQAIGWLAGEELDAHGFNFFSHHTFSEKLGPKLMHTPVVILFSLYCVGYISIVLTNLILYRGQVRPPRSSTGVRALPELCAASVVNAAVFTSYDVAIDPVSTRLALYHWTDLRQPLFFGVPVQNYVGWMVASTLVFFVYRLLEGYVARARPASSGRLYALLPVAYWCSSLCWLLAAMGRNGFGPELSMSALFAAGLPAVLATFQIVFAADADKAKRS